ncbi:uncharacterized protein LAESUDRAFT_814817 [Laetiporus sulphureus 93-53]|uniref:STE3-domain-containing protein n=1 Tax=Laetiporus sulphureus 93-53 TaxID=1314785 RepID=A0A165CP71_9APHY|nr:uncharacterized protein LAESUDRAFT_814817 [Laetiporus sulphureus 93-53]KZT03164.1 hypothetical protein LAESUDRAFT_814817 [Laetiporus sulphureus 93-53]
MLLALVFVYYFSQRSVAAPISDVQSVEDISPSCDKLSDCRTLLSIVSSCFATIIACVWTAVHPDIPPYGEDPWWQTFRRMWFTISAIIAPEIYIFTATFQYLNARSIARMNVFKEHGWTTTHGFFVLMGGFALCDPSEHSTKQLDYYKLICLIENNEINFPHISKEEIQDRSKANWLSKMAAVVQTCWFTLQVIARPIERLPITELEIFTASYTIMAIAMYALWFAKPFCIDVSIVLHKNPNAITAIMDALARSIANAADAPNLQRTVEEADHPTNTNEVELGLLDNYSRSTAVHSHLGSKTSRHCHSVQREERTCLQNLIHPLRLIWNSAYERIRGPIHAHIKAIRDKKNSFHRGLPRAVLAVIWPLLVVLYIILAPFFFIFAPLTFEQWWHGGSSLDDTISDAVLSAAVTSCAVVVPILFGLIHCTAWYSHFPTVTEQYLWRVLSLVITYSPVIVVCMAGIGAISQSVPLPKIVKIALEQFSTILVIITTLLYVPSRLILLAIAFTTLRELPPGAYKTISWVELIPHF